jgi:hypothetical protein
MSRCKGTNWFLNPAPVFERAALAGRTIGALCLLRAAAATFEILMAWRCASGAAEESKTGRAHKRPRQRKMNPTRYSFRYSARIRVRG